jgi:hypothetical protein
MFMTDTQYSDLFGFLVKKFDMIDQKFEQIDRRFDEIDRRFEQIDRRFEKIENTIDFILGKILTFDQEKIIGAGRTARLESWVQKAAKKIDLPYNP